MRNSSLLSFLAAFSVALSGCSKSETPSPSKTEVEASSPRSSTGSPLDACSLLTSDEIKSIQGEALESVKSTTPSAGELSTSQCFFSLPTFINSISLQVVQKGTTPGEPDARQAWNKLFPPNKLQERETESGKKKIPPRKIPGLGEEALWTGGPAGGLYVLQGRSYFRISVGGADDEETKIRKSTLLAQFILKRL